MPDLTQNLAGILNNGFCLANSGRQTPMNSRRTFLKQISGAAVGVTAAHSFIARALPQMQAGSINTPGEDGMIVRSSHFVDLETPVEYLDSWLTPVPHFFVRNHMNEPSELSTESWQLRVGGEVEKTLTLTLADVRELDSHSVVNTLECAGNGRSMHRPQVPGVQWGKGAVSTAKFSGPRLREVLQRAGVKANGKHVMFRGLDEVPGKVPPFIRSIPIEKALDSDTLIATHMNGEPLTKHHGFPARALVPGWIGAASCSSAGARVGRRCFLQMAHGNQSPRIGIRRQLHEPGLSLPQSAG